MEAGKPLSEAKARLLRSTKKGKCSACEARAGKDSPLKGLLSKLASSGECGCKDEPADKKVIVTVLKDVPDHKQPLNEKPVAEAEKHQTSPFTQRCVAAITGGKPGGREGESRAFAICNAQKNKSDKNLDKSALERPGYKSRKAEFVKSLAAARKKTKKKYG